MAKLTVAVRGERVSMKSQRFRLLTYTSLASSLLLSGLVLASPALAADQSGNPGNDAGPSTAGQVSLAPVTVDNPGGITIVSGASSAAGSNGTSGGPATGTAAAGGGTAGSAGPLGGAGGTGGNAESANGTGGRGGHGGSGTGGGVSGTGLDPITVDINGNIVTGVNIVLGAGAGTGGNGDKGGGRHRRQQCGGHWRRRRCRR